MSTTILIFQTVNVFHDFDKTLFQCVAESSDRSEVYIGS